VEYRGDSIRYRVGVPAVQAFIFGFCIFAGLAAVYVAARYADALGLWAWLILAGAEPACYLLAWRAWQDIRAPYSQERATGEDVNRDNYIGDPRIKMRPADIDRHARHVLQLLHNGRSVSRATLAPNTMSATAWGIVRKRLVGRGAVELDNKGEMAARYGTWQEAWDQYLEGPRGLSFKVNRDDELVEAE
jgi:hypothetical protein